MCGCAHQSCKQVPSAKQDEILQVRCYTADRGHVWIESYDALPPVVRKRLRNSPFNLCAACLVMFVLPKVRRKYPTREKALFAAIEIMEAEVRKDKP